MTNEEIARFEQFLPLSQCSQISPAAEASESVYMWERVKRKSTSKSLNEKAVGNSMGTNGHE